MKRAGGGGGARKSRMFKIGRAVSENITWVLMLGISIEFALGFYTCFYVHTMRKCERGEFRGTFKDDLQAIASVLVKDKKEVNINVKREIQSDMVIEYMKGIKSPKMDVVDYSYMEKKDSRKSRPYKFTHGEDIYDLKLMSEDLKECVSVKYNYSVPPDGKLAFIKKIKNIVAFVRKGKDDNFKDILPPDISALNQNTMFSSMLLKSAI